MARFDDIRFQRAFNRLRRSRRKHVDAMAAATGIHWWSVIFLILGAW